MTVCQNYKESTTRVDDCYIHYYYPEYQNMESYNQYILESAKETMKINTQYFGKYPYNELDIVSCYYSSAMEYSGLIFLGLPDIKDLNQIDKTNYSNMTQVVAHEVTHQWFCITIGNDQYYEPWLDEGFAEYVEDIIFPLQSTIYKKAVDDDNDRLQTDIPYYSNNQFDQYVTQCIQQRSKNHGINEPYHEYLTYDQPEGINHKIVSSDDYSTYVYTNGSYFLYELSKAMGEKFQQMMKDYYQTYYLKEVTTIDFINKIYQYSDSKKTYQIIHQYINQSYLIK